MSTIDDLPPECRFLIRVTHAGVGLAEAAAMFGTGAADAARRLRRGASAAGVPLPAAADGVDALLASLHGPLDDLVDAVETAPRRDPKTPCPHDDVTDAFRKGVLGGPLALVTAEHLADCRHCLRRFLDRRAGRLPLDYSAAPVRARTSPGSVIAMTLRVIVFALVALLAAVVLIDGLRRLL